MLIMATPSVRTALGGQGSDSEAADVQMVMWCGWCCGANGVVGPAHVQMVMVIWTLDCVDLQYVQLLLWC